MKLNELLKNIKPIGITGDTDTEITGVNIDSRLIAAGQLFVAMKGTQVDGHQFISKAIEQGAAAVLCEDMPESVAAGITFVQVTSTEDAAGKVATLFYGDPSRKLKLVGVTGTNGKTTVATLLYNMFRAMGYKCGLLSTVCNYIEDEAIAADHTTPDPIELNQLLHRMVEARYCSTADQRPFICRRHLYKPYSRPFRLSQDLRKLSKRQEIVLRWATKDCFCHHEC